MLLLSLLTLRPGIPALGAFALLAHKKEQLPGLLD